MAKSIALHLRVICIGEEISVHLTSDVNLLLQFAFVRIIHFASVQMDAIKDW